MFRRRWSGLPADPVFAADFKELGYFINDIDEIRSIDNSDYYFKYYLTKNSRWNERQRFAFNEAVRKTIHARLTAPSPYNFTTVRLPLGTPPSQPHVPVLTSPHLAAASRVVLLVGEPCQALGVLAHRVICGRGGITRGSVLGLVGALTAAAEAAAQPPPGVVLANTGELWWWPEGGRGLTPVERHAVPMASAVHWGRWHEKENEIEGHRTVREHVRAVFEEVVLNGEMVDERAKVDVIAVGDAADEVEGYLDDEEVWKKVGTRLNCLVVMGGFYSSANFKCEGFRRFMKERGRAYVIHHTPVDTPVAGPSGNPGASGFTSFGCPVYSAGPAAKYTETMLIEAQREVVSWIQQVALAGDAYKNEVFAVFGEEGTGVTTEELDSPWGAPETGVAETKKAQTEKAEAKARKDNAVGDDSQAQFQPESAKMADEEAKPDVEKATNPSESDGAEDGKAGGQQGMSPPSLSKDFEVKDLANEIEDLTIG